jgi:integrase
MARELLSARELESKIKSATEEAARRNTRILIGDGNNLMLVVRPNGGASWVLKYRLNGRRNMHSLGAWPDLNLKRAREAADKARDKVLAGVDPVEHKREERQVKQEERAAPSGTVLQLFNDWLRKKRTSSIYHRNITAALEKDVLPAIGAKQVDEVTRSDIVEILRKLEDRNALVMLRRVRMYLKQMWEFALDEEPPRATSMPVPTGHLKSFLTPEPGHFPAITERAAAKKLMQAIHGYDRTIVRAALLLAAHTFQRPTEVRSARWEEFDLQAGKWTLQAERMKKRRDHLVPLSKSVVALLKAHQGVVGTHGWLFPGMRRDQPISEGTLNAALDTLGYKGKHCAHGFRAMARTLIAEELKIDERFIEKQLAHEIDKQLRGAYNRAQHWDDRVKMMQAWSSWLDAQSSAR